MTYRDTNRTALPQRRFRIHACALCNMMETLRYTFVTHYLLMAGQAKWTDGSPVNVGPASNVMEGILGIYSCISIDLPAKIYQRKWITYDYSRLLGFDYFSLSILLQIEIAFNHWDFRLKLKNHFEERSCKYRVDLISILFSRWER